MTGDRPFALPELLAPAGSWDCAKAAIENGADAIYFGLDCFNARMRAENFTEAELPDLMAMLHRRGVKGYLTLNTLIFTQELAQAEAYLRSVIAAGVDAAIVQDVGLCRLIRHLSPDFPIHASTQMTITSAAGVAFAQALGCSLVVLARECSVNEIEKIRQQMGDRNIALPLEVFVHGALCVAYSGQCLTSEALGGRSANRGECAQACRMPYELVVDGEPMDLADEGGDRRYLLSPQDLAGLPLLPELVRSGVSCLKIEGRLKTPEYVASVTQVYRSALDRLQREATQPSPSLPSGQTSPSPDERYRLEMAFSRGLYSGWLGGIDNQALVHGHFAKKRGAYLGQVSRVQQGRVTLKLDSALSQMDRAAVKPGDGVVFEGSQGDSEEVGGRLYEVQWQVRQEAHQEEPTAVLSFSKTFDTSAISVGDRVWKTSDPDLDRQIRQTYAGETPRTQQPLTLEVHGALDTPLTLIARDRQGHMTQVQSNLSLVSAHSRPLTPDVLHKQLGRLGNTPFTLGDLSVHLDGDLMLPMSELNRLRREAVGQIEAMRSRPLRWTLLREATHADLLPAQASPPQTNPTLIVLVRRLDQLQAALSAGITTLYCELEDPRAYRQAVQQVRQFGGAEIWVAPPRITKPRENWILDQVRGCGADGYLVRNYDHLAYFAGSPCIGDFSLNIANPITAAHFKALGLQRLTASYDLNVHQLEALLHRTPSWFEVTLHQHMPLFHMEHCVFCAFLSEGKDYRDCGRPCETHAVTLRDRAGVEHVLQADAGCRNTLFNGRAQTGAEYVQRLLSVGLQYVRLEFLQESAGEVGQTIQQYQRLLQGKTSGAQLWQTLKLQHRLGVTRGPLDQQ